LTPPGNAVGIRGDAERLASMKRWRGRLRLARAMLATFSWYLLWAIGHLILLPAARTRRRWRRWIMRHWCASICRAFAVRVRVVGEPPRGGAFLVCNHLSYLDIPVLGSCFPTTFVSKAEVASWPLIGMLARQFDTVFLVRERKRELPEAIEQIERALGEGDGVVVFPEGTSTRGDDVLPFRASLLAPAAQAELAVHCASLTYRVGPADPSASNSVCWWGDMAFAPHVRGLLALDEIEACVDFASEPISGSDRKALAEKLREAVKARFRPIP
jgi:1-acyl-sn-glycerol-3-phosphate acyltransferase